MYNQCVNLVLERAVEEATTGMSAPLASLSEDGGDLPRFPSRGEVDLIEAGFPCQSFSGLNR